MEAGQTFFFFLFFGAAFTAIAFVIIEIIILFYTRIPPTGTPPALVEKILDTLDIQPGHVVYDLGCGDGRLVIAAARRGAQATGFEISPFAYLCALTKKIISRSRAKIRYKNFHRAHLFDANIVFCFLANTAMERLETKLLHEIPSGARVVSYALTFPNWKISSIITPNPRKDRSLHSIYIYTK